MKISDVVLGMIVFIAIIIGFSSFYGTIATVYLEEQPDLTYSNMSSTFNSYNEINTHVEEIGNLTTSISKKIQNPLEWISGLGDTAGLFISVGGILGEIPNVMTQWVNSIQSVIVIPSWFVPMILAIVSTIFVFKIVSIFLKREV